MSAETKTYEDKMTGVINHLVKEHATIRAGRANQMCIRDRLEVGKVEGYHFNFR